MWCKPRRYMRPRETPKVFCDSTRIKYPCYYRPFKNMIGRQGGTERETDRERKRERKERERERERERRREEEEGERREGRPRSRGRIR